MFMFLSTYLLWETDIWVSVVTNGSENNIKTRHPTDHNVLFLPYFASEDADTLDEIFRATGEAELQCNLFIFFLGL